MASNPSSKRKDKCIEARVISIETGHLGPYLVAMSDDNEVQGSVTCSLGNGTWTDDRPPNIGEFVILGDLTMTSGGLRANTGRFWRISDHND